MKDTNVPEHVAIILDGNGRWAKKRLMPRRYGHAQGSKVVERICEDAYKMGIEYLTVYAFSTENWKRPQDEVETLMSLLRSYLKDCIKISTKNNMRVRIIGNVSGLADDIREAIRHLEETSAKNTGLKFQVALNYGGRDEIVRGVKALAKDLEAGNLRSEDITEKSLESYLDTKDIPDPDLLIRTSGEQRLSNFMLWQIAYSELYYTDVLWPDFTKDDLQKAIDYYNSRDRRYGGV
ncbi:isoprenyl transferase [Anaerolentibacter hominis]|uniref:isoprenyl transferase n=1 Tax=Anaerolentibacter hominis TaxID=3079009 RepID=UPI0031B86C08